MAETSVADGIVNTAPRRSRLMLPSKAFGFARKMAIIILFKAASEREPTRQATPRSVAFAPTLTVLRGAGSPAAVLAFSEARATSTVDLGMSASETAGRTLTGAVSVAGEAATARATGAADGNPGGSSSSVY